MAGLCPMDKVLVKFASRKAVVKSIEHNLRQRDVKRRSDGEAERHTHWLWGGPALIWIWVGTRHINPPTPKW
jgi:hypothetical protein